MSRNDMNHFAVNPEVHIGRSKFNMNQNIKLTGNTGDIIPFYFSEVLPGDTFEIKTSMVARLQTLIHPLMDNIFLDTYYFFVPNRLVWDNWQHFCGEPDQAWKPSRDYTVPTIQIIPSLPAYQTDGNFDFDKLAAAFKDTILDYLGVGFGPNVGTMNDISINALPIRAYNKIYDDWFRDENVIAPVNLFTGDTDLTFDKDDPLLGGKCRKAAKLHDYFTSSLPQAQRGDPVTLSADFNGQKALPVGTAGLGQSHDSNLASTSWVPMSLQTDNGDIYSMRSTSISGQNQQFFYRNGTVDSGGYAPNNLYAQLIGDNVSLGITINDLRLAFQVQKFMEKSAMHGARYIELIQGMFGVSSPDGRLQRSEYLGGHRVPITIHQIVNQTEQVNAPLGNTGGMSMTTDTHHDFIHSFTEHGTVLGLAVIRYKHSYSQGYNRAFLRRTKFDYYWPVFASIGSRPVMNDEIYVDGSTNGTVFGWQEAWAEYRYTPDRVCGEMRPGIPNTLASWHLGDYYTSAPTLSEGWIAEDIAPVDRAIAVTSEVADQFLFDIYVQNTATRPMPVYSIPGLVDHY